MLLWNSTQIMLIKHDDSLFYKNNLHKSIKKCFTIFLRIWRVFFFFGGGGDIVFLNQISTKLKQFWETRENAHMWMKFMYMSTPQ